MYRPERISHQKSVAVSEGVGCGKFAFARPVYFSMVPAGQVTRFKLSTELSADLLLVIYPQLPTQKLCLRTQ